MEGLKKAWCPHRTGIAVFRAEGTGLDKCVSKLEYPKLAA